MRKIFKNKDDPPKEYVHDRQPLRVIVNELATEVEVLKANLENLKSLVKILTSLLITIIIVLLTTK